MRLFLTFTFERSVLQAVSWYRSTAARGILLGASLGTALPPASYAFEKEPRREGATGVGTMKLKAVIFCGACLVTAAVESRQRLWVAAHTGDLDTVRAELAKGADVNQPLESMEVVNGNGMSRALTTGATPLMAAIAENHPEIVKTLVAHGADLARGDDEGLAPMHCAIGPYDEIFETFVEAVLASAADPRALVNAVGQGVTPLQRAIVYGSERMLRWLLDMGADPAAPGHHSSKLPSHAFRMWKVIDETMNMHKDLVEGMRMIDILLDSGLDIDTPGRGGRTALGFACDIERRDFIGFIVSRGADVSLAQECEPHLGFIINVANIVEEGRIPRERLEMVFTLLRKDPWPLHTASQDEDDGDVIEILLALGYGPHINTPSDCCGVQPLHVAAKFGKTAVAAALLRAGADVNAVATRGSKISKYNGQRPLDIAREFARTGVADLLARHGGTVNGEDLRRQRSPLDDPLPDLDLMLMESNDHDASHAVSEAIKNGDPNYEYGFENGGVKEPASVLHAAAQQGYVEAVRELLRLGADTKALFRAPDRGWVTPLHVAAQSGRARIVEILVQDGDVDIDTLSADNATALCIAVDRGFVRTTQSLLSLGASPNVDCWGEGASLLFAKKAIIVEKLVRHGADRRSCCARD